MEDVGGGMAYSSLRGTLSLCKVAAVLTHQGTVRKDRRLCQGTRRLLYAIPPPTGYRKALRFLGFGMFVTFISSAAISSQSMPFGNVSSSFRILKII